VNDTRNKHVELLNKEIASMRGWLDFLERDLANDKGVIHALIIQSISESAMKLAYNAGIANGAVLSGYDVEQVKGGESS
jgi:hypothetical protein